MYTKLDIVFHFNEMNFVSFPFGFLTYINVEATILFTMETQMHTAGPICVSGFITCNVAHNAGTKYALETLEFSHVICICVYIIKRNDDFELT